MANLPCSYKRQKGKNGKFALLLKKAKMANLGSSIQDNFK
jgi:hypothetical protein